MNPPPLQGIRVVELASVLAGPAVGMFFAELGAEVIKVENRTTGGDMTRKWKSPSEDPDSPISAYFSSINYGKDYLHADLNVEQERAEVLHLIQKADILINNMKASAVERFGLKYEDLKASNPRLICAELSGFADDQGKLGFDVVLQAETGYIHMTGHPEAPAKLPVALIDVLAAHQIKEGILLSLYLRERDGKGAHIRTSLEEASLASLTNQASNYLMSGISPGRMGTLHPNIAPYGEIIHSSDGVSFVLAIGTDAQFRSFVELIDRSEILKRSEFQNNQERVIHRRELHSLLQEGARQLTADHLEQGAMERGIPLGRIRDLQEVLTSPTAQKMILKEEIEDHATQRLATVAFHIDR